MPARRRRSGSWRRPARIAAEAWAQRFYGRQPVQEKAVASGPNHAAQNASRDADASDGLSEGQRWHEEFRAKEVARAEALFGDLPMGDGVRYDEPNLSSPQEFSLEMPDDLAANLQEGEAQQITSAFIEAGVGRTLANDLVRQGIAASRRGPLSAEQVERRNAEGMAALQAKWGDRTGEKLALAKGMIDEAAQRWPGLRSYLNATGLGSDPKLIQQLVARAERREAMTMSKRQQKRRDERWGRPKGRWTLVDSLSATPRQERPAVAEREIRFEAILTALYYGDLSRAAAADRLVTELGIDRQAAQAEVDAFLRD